jgi:DnaK suppressor protein
MAQRDRERQMRLRNCLMEEKRRLWNEFRAELFETLGVDLHSQFDIPQDIGEQGIIDLLEDTGLALAAIRRQELTRMDEAMRKLVKGRYGMSDACGKEIDEARRRVDPYVPCCVRCQERREGLAATPGLTL